MKSIHKLCATAAIGLVALVSANADALVITASGNGNCANASSKTKTVPHTLPAGNYKARLVQGSNFFTWPSVVVLP
jgi:hypothetical protein